MANSSGNNTQAEAIKIQSQMGLAGQSKVSANTRTPEPKESSKTAENKGEQA